MCAEYAYVRRICAPNRAMGRETTMQSIHLKHHLGSVSTTLSGSQNRGISTGVQLRC